MKKQLENSDADMEWFLNENSLIQRGGYLSVAELEALRIASIPRKHQDLQDAFESLGTKKHRV